MIEDNKKGSGCPYLLGANIPVVLQSAADIGGGPPNQEDVIQSGKLHKRLQHSWQLDVACNGVALIRDPINAFWSPMLFWRLRFGGRRGGGANQRPVQRRGQEVE